MRRIEATAGRLPDEAARYGGAFYKRGAGSLRRLGRSRIAWNKDGQHAAIIKRLQGKQGQICAKVELADQHRASCQCLLTPAGKPAA